jgi:FkbM family methyltransferase
MFRFLEKALGRVHRLAHRALCWVELTMARRRCQSHGFKLLLPSILSVNAAHLLLRDGMDGEDHRLSEKYLKPGDWVVNAGSGCGLSAMTAAKCVAPDGKVIGIEADPEIHALSAKNLALNNVSNVDLHHGAVVANRMNQEIPFYKKANYYGSNLSHNNSSGVRISVPAIYLPDLLQSRQNHNCVFLCDIEGYETDLLLDDETVSCFQMILVEIHPKSHSTDKASPLAPMFNHLYERGFQMIDVDDEVFVFRRA